MKRENNYDILLADALHSSDYATRACTISYQRYPIEQMQRSAQTISHRSCLASDFVVLVLSEAVLSETVLVLDGYSNFSDADR